MMLIMLDTDRSTSAVNLLVAIGNSCTSSDGFVSDIRHGKPLACCSCFVQRGGGELSDCQRMDKT